MPPRNQLISSLHSFTSERLSGTRTAQPVRLLAGFAPESRNGADHVLLAHLHYYTTIPADRTTHEAVNKDSKNALSQTGTVPVRFQNLQDGHGSLLRPVGNMI